MKKITPLALFIWLINFITYGQNIGIGETLPQSKLEIKGNNTLSLSNSLLVKNSNNDSLFRITNAGEVIAGSKTKDFGQLQLINNGNLARHLLLKGTNHNNTGQFFTNTRFTDETENRFWQFRSLVYGEGSGNMNHSKSNTFSIGTDSLPDMITIDGTGKMAMGESFNPQAYLDIATNFNSENIPQLMLRGTGIQNRSYQYFADIGGSNFWYIESRHDALIPSNSSFNFGYNGIRAMGLDNERNLIVGTEVSTTNSGKLKIFNNSSGVNAQLLLHESESNDYSRLRFTNNNAGKYWDVAGYLDPSDAASRLNFFHNVTGNVLTLTGDGKAGFNNSSPHMRTTVQITGSVAAGTTPLMLVSIKEYVDNAAALAAGLPVGAIYRTGDLLKIVH